MQETRSPAARRSLITGIVIGATIAAFVVTGTNVLSFVSSAKAQITTDRPANLLSFADIVDKVKPAVVSVRTKSEAPANMSGEESGEIPPNMERFFRRFFGDQVPGPNRIPRNRRSQGQGSGFFISADGYVVTNNHVIDKTTTVEVQTDDGKTYAAKVIGTDPRTDLALLKVDGREDFPWVRLAPAAPRIGDWVLAVGNPFGLGGTVTAGIVSARGRDIGASTYDDFIQIDAAVNRGNSGGPTFNLAGEVIGVNTAIVSPTGGNVGIAFAIPAETVQTVVAALRAGKTVERGYLGVQIQPVTQEIAESLNLKSQEGALVGEVQPGLPAANAGIKARDVIIDVDGTPIKTARELQRKIASLRPDSTTKVKVIRDGKEQVINVKLAKLPDQQLASTDPRMEKRKGPRGKDRGRSDNFETNEQNLSELGITVAPASEVQGASAEGIVVTDVDMNGPAAERGLRTGDVILDIGGRTVSKAKDLNDAITKARAEGKSVIMLRVKSQGGARFVTLPAGKG
ncbi:MAG: Do family serine endopeptidase [Rhizobiales bacterium]|jgi:serine protease Do|nr:Do family serine endopeptidase [Hyphomicrobiales bacterium]